MISSSLSVVALLFSFKGILNFLLGIVILAVVFLIIPIFIVGYFTGRVKKKGNALLPADIRNETTYADYCKWAADNGQAVHFSKSSNPDLLFNGNN